MSTYLTPRFVAEISLIGMGLDLFGGFYLAYDLLGGKHGPLRTLARTAGYIMLFFIGYVVLLGLWYALIASVGMGILLTAEYRFAPGLEGDQFSRLTPAAFGMLRGVVIGVAAATIAGAQFAAAFGLLSGLGLVVLSLARFSPADDYERRSNLRLTRHKLLATAWRAAVISAAGVIASMLPSSNTHSMALGIKLGLAAGAVNALVTTFSPPIEWWIENLPERRLGAAGLGLILIGMLLQSFQYWTVLLNNP
jgi:hypothetical protein